MGANITPPEVAMAAPDTFKIKKVSRCSANASQRDQPFVSVQVMNTLTEGLSYVIGLVRNDGLIIWEV